MSNFFDADELGLAELKLNGKTHSFRPATIADEREYLPTIQKRFDKAKGQGERDSIRIEVIRKYIPELSEDELRTVSPYVLVNIYYFAIHGIKLPKEKN